MSNPYQLTIDALNTSGVRYVIAGGFAVVMHGFNRFTPDVNIVVDFEQESVTAAMDALVQSGFEPQQDIDVYKLWDTGYRYQLQIEQGHRFLCLKDPRVPSFKIEFFLEHPLSLCELKASSFQPIIHGLVTPICSFEHLINMKLSADRGQDRIDIESLMLAEAIRHRLHGGETEDEILASATSDLERAQMSVLCAFIRLTPDEKIEWLLEMLTKLGRFCLL